MNDRKEWDHNRWARIYAKFEHTYKELPRQLFIEIAQLQASPPIRRILDIGSGDGKGLEYLHSRLPSTELVGIDPDPAMVRLARARVRTRARVILASAEDFPESLGRFDLILSYMNLHLWAEPARGLKRLQSALTGDGMAYLVDVPRDISARLREEILNCLPSHANFRAVFVAQIDRGVTIEEVRGLMNEAGITAYRLREGLPWGPGRGAGVAAGRTGRQCGPIAEIMRQMAETGLGERARSASYHQIQVFVYPQLMC